MKYEHLILDERGHVALVTISKPETLNALDMALLQEMHHLLHELSHRDDLRCIIITGEGKAFVSGADIAYMSGLDASEALAFGEAGCRVFSFVEGMPCPVIAAVNGYAFGGGCELALACDIRLGSERAQFAQPEVGLGITAGFGGTQRLPRTVGLGVAAELLYTGRRVKADEAKAIGLLNSVHPEGELMGAAWAMAEQIASNAPVAVRGTKSAIQHGMGMALNDAIAFENSRFSLCFATQDQKKGMAAFLNKEKYNYTGE